jgi:hypothetical protein
MDAHLNYCKLCGERTSQELILTRYIGDGGWAKWALACGGCWSEHHRTRAPEDDVIERCSLGDGITRGLLHTIAALVREGLACEGAHHKQWYLEQIADELGIPHESAGVAP